MLLVIAANLFIYGFVKQSQQQDLIDFISNDLLLLSHFSQQLTDPVKSDDLHIIRSWYEQDRRIGRLLINNSDSGEILNLQRAGVVVLPEIIQADLIIQDQDFDITIWVDKTVLDQRLNDLMLLLLLGSSLIAGLVYYIFRRWQNQPVVELDENYLSAMIEHLPSIMFLKDTQGRYLMANRQFEKDMGLSAKEIIGKTDFDLFSAENAETYQHCEQKILNTLAPYEAEEVVAVDGKNKIFLNKRFPIQNINGELYGVGGISIDVTDYKQASYELAKKTRALKVLSKVDSAMVRATSEREWLQNVCQLLVEDGGYRFSWIGFAEQSSSRHILPVADAGYDEGFLQFLVSGYVSEAVTVDPACRAIETNKACVISDTWNNEQFEFWRDESLKRNYRSICCLPIPMKDAFLGVLSIYSDETDAFDEAEIALLGELVNDIGFGIHSLRMGHERIKATNALSSEKQKFEQIVEGVNAGVLLLDPEFRVLWANSTFQLWFGDLEKIQGISCDSCFCGNGSEKHECTAQKSKASVQVEHKNFESVTVSGEKKYFEAVTAPLVNDHGGIIQYVELIHDITHQKMLEMHREESEEQLKQAQHIAQVGSWKFDVKRSELSCSDELLRIYQEVPDISKPFYEAFVNAVHADDRTRVIKNYKESVERRKSYEMAHRILLQDGVIRYVHVRGECVLDEFGELDSVIGTVQDVTDMVQVEQALLSTEQHYRSLVETTTAIPWELDLNSWRFIFVGPQAIKVLGYPLEDWYCENFWADHLHPDDKEMAIRVYRDAIENLQDHEFVYRMLSADGRMVWIRDDVKVIKDSDNSTRLQGFKFDITEQVYADEVMRRSQKMDAVGQLTGGIAHDFNNQLGVVQGYLDFLADFTMGKDAPHRWVVAADKATRRCIDLSRKLLNFSRQNQLEEEPVVVNSVLEKMKELVAKSVTPTIKINYELADDLWPVEVNSGELEDVILNLAINARDAMPHGGSLSVITQNHKLDEGHIQYFPGFDPGDYVHIIVRDTGFGIEKEYHERIFEPFFTTKEEGQGTGLGLSMVYSFVQRSSGMITFYSELGEGTTFHIYLPRYYFNYEGHDVLIQNATDLSQQSGRGEIVLLVDDEKELRELASALLEMFGYQVIEAANGAEAIEVLEGETQIDLLFSDIIMPGGISGYELAERAVELRQDIKVLLTSGFAGDLSQATEENWLMLNKPYSKSELAKSVAELIGTKTIHDSRKYDENEDIDIVEWDDALLIGHDEMDDDHQQLLAMLDDYAKAIGNDTIDEKAGEMLGMLIHHTAEHFKREEALMRATDYPNYSNHHQVHDMLLKMASDLLKVFQQDKGIFDHKSTLSFLRHWLIGHIVSMDVPYGRYIQNLAIDMNKVMSKSGDYVVDVEVVDRPRLIVIDDEKNMGGLVKDVADSAGFDSVHYIHASEFVAHHDDHAAVIVLDLYMPDFDGIEMIRLLAGMECKSALILISGVDKSVLHSAHELAIEHDLNIVGALQKPFHPSELRQLLLSVSSKLSQEEARKHTVFDSNLISIDEIRQAIADKQFIGYYQPQISLQDFRVIGFEVLMRWLHPVRGLVVPLQFIPLAESSGLIEDMTWNLLDSVAEDWVRHDIQQTVSINMTAAMFKSLDLPERLHDIGEKRNFSDNSLLILEVTESALMEELTKSLDSLTRLRMKGFQLSIDDFGTGYSSMVQLYRAPFSELKVDQSFVMRMEKDPEARAIVESTIDLGHNLDMKVVAEGVETQSIMRKLKHLGCDVAQGYHIARPMPIDEVMEWMAEWNMRHGHDPVL
ncbi:MAG: bacteriohemerythrin [Gammaproteobacteria bacterium]